MECCADICGVRLLNGNGGVLTTPYCGNMLPYRTLSADGGSPELNLKSLLFCNVSYSVTNILLSRLLSGNVTICVMYVTLNTYGVFAMSRFLIRK